LRLADGIHDELVACIWYEEGGLSAGWDRDVCPLPADGDGALEITRTTRDHRRSVGVVVGRGSGTHWLKTVTSTWAAEAQAIRAESTARRILVDEDENNILRSSKEQMYKLGRAREA